MFLNGGYMVGGRIAKKIMSGQYIMLTFCFRTRLLDGKYQSSDFVIAVVAVVTLFLL